MSKRSCKKNKEEMENAIAKKIEIAIAEITKQLDSATDPSVLSSLQGELAIYQGQLVKHPSVPIPLQDQLAILQVDLENLSTEKISQRPICRPIIMSEENQRPICQFIPPKRMSEKTHSTEKISRKSCKSNKEQLESAIAAISRQLGIATDPSVRKSLHEQLAIYQGYLENRSTKNSPICGGEPIETPKIYSTMDKKIDEKKDELIEDPIYIYSNKKKLKITIEAITRQLDIAIDKTVRQSLRDQLAIYQGYLDNHSAKRVPKDGITRSPSCVLLCSRDDIWNFAERSDFMGKKKGKQLEDGTFAMVTFGATFTSVRVLVKTEKWFKSIELAMQVNEDGTWTEKFLVCTNKKTERPTFGQIIGGTLEDRSDEDRLKDERPKSYTIMESRGCLLETQENKQIKIKKLPDGSFHIFNMHEGIPVNMRLRLEFVNGLIIVSSPQGFKRLDCQEFPDLGLYLGVKADQKRQELAKQKKQELAKQKK